MPFVYDPPEPTPDKLGKCSVCEARRRIWKFGERVVPLGADLTVVLSYAICRDCIEVVFRAVLEDDD